jgi:hypothetical protein
MTKPPDGERLAVLEEQSKELKISVDGVKTSMASLHTKFDTLSTTISERYVSKDTFDEYKKSRLLERVLTILVSTAITALVMYFFNQIAK